MGFSGLWVVWSLLGAPGEKKRENQMYLQDFHTFAPLQFAKSVLNIVQIFAKSADFIVNFHYFWSKSMFFASILMKISRNFKSHALIFNNLEIQEIKR